MEDPSRTNPERIKEISALKQKIKELEQAESERKRAPEALRESEEYFKAIIQNSSDIILIVDRMGTITYASPSIERFLGYVPDELIGKRSLDLILSDDKPKAIADFGRALLTKEIVIPDVFRVRHKDGTERILEGFGKNLLDNPVVAGFVMNVRDVTARKQAEKALRESEERYRTLVEKATDIVFRTDDNGRITFVNPAVIRITGYEEEEIIGKQYTIFIRPDMRDEAMKFFGRQFVKGIQNTYSEYPMLTKDGQEVWFGQNTQLIVEDGNVRGFQVVARDITDRKRIEKELSDSEEKYRKIVEASSDAVLLRSKDIIIYANPAALKLFRANHPGDLLGKRYLDLVHPDDLAISTERMKKTMDENWIASPREHRILALDGQVVHVESTGVPVKYRDETHVFGIFRDITDRKQAEEALASERTMIRTIIDSLPDRIYVKDLDRRFMLNNTAHITALGAASGADVLGRTDHDFRTPERADRYAADDRDVMQSGRPLYNREEVTMLPSGKEGWLLSSKMPLRDAEGKIVGLVGISRDITDRKRIEEALKDSEERYRELSIIDDLTQLYNSRYFYHQLKLEIDRSKRYEQPLTLLLLDLDNFKAFNDAYGHVEGDLVLFRLGQVVKRCLRQTDSAYRYGGEEFTILLPMTTSADGAVTAERIRTEFKKENFAPVPGEQVHVTVSIGLAQYKTQEDMKAFVHRVDQLMYQGKNCGKDRVCSEL